jgi:hypothetical protein
MTIADAFKTMHRFLVKNVIIQLVFFSGMFFYGAIPMKMVKRDAKITKIQSNLEAFFGLI